MDDQDYIKGKKALQKLSPEDVNDAITLLAKGLLGEVRFGLGLLDVPDEIYEKDFSTPMFDAVMEAFKQAAHGCYICDPTIDPNGEQFTGNICINCQQKLGNVMKFLGVKDYEKILPMAGERKVQKKRG